MANSDMPTNDSTIPEFDLDPTTEAVNNDLCQKTGDQSTNAKHELTQTLREIKPNDNVGNHKKTLSTDSFTTAVTNQAAVIDEGDDVELKKSAGSDHNSAVNTPRKSTRSATENIAHLTQQFSVFGTAEPQAKVRPAMETPKVDKAAAFKAVKAAQASKKTARPVPATTYKVVPEADYTVFIVAAQGKDGEDNTLLTDPEFVDPVPDLKKPAAIKVCKKVLTDASEYFRNIFNTSFGSRWSEASEDYIVLEGDRAKALLLIFHLLHDLDSKAIASTFGTPIREIWHMIAECEKYQIEMDSVGNWFSRWYSHHERDITNRKIKPALLLYPTYVFDHAKGFARCTKQLVLDTKGNFEHEINPSGHHALRLSTTFLHRLLAVRGHLQKRIVEELERVIDPFFESTCPCRYEVVYCFYEALRHLEIWPYLASKGPQDSSNLPRFYRPSDTDPKHHLYDVCKRLEHDFETLEISCTICETIHTIHKDKIIRIGRKCRESFDGLCLDCMDDDSLPRTSQWEDGEEIYHRADFKQYITSRSEMQGEREVKINRHDMDCRIHHGQPTQYWSIGLRRDPSVPKARSSARATGGLAVAADGTGFTDEWAADGPLGSWAETVDGTNGW